MPLDGKKQVVIEESREWNKGNVKELKKIDTQLKIEPEGSLLA